MNEIRAFVGHSFAEDDGDIVGRFLKFFNQISQIHPPFSWEHAEAAEPKELAKKVLTLFEGKNLFIGICTKRELAISEKALVPLAFQPHYLKMRSVERQWKTSDWIIQEIGLAVGRGLDLLLLIEDGVRTPGGLQGNVEHISFNRTNPERAFGKVLEMIHALTPRLAGMTGLQAESADADANSVQTREPKIGGNTEDLPGAHWTKDDYDNSLFQKIVANDGTGVEELTKAFLATEYARDTETADEWEARTNFWKIVLGTGGSLERLEEIANSHPTNSVLRRNLARAYLEYDDYEHAAQTYEQAAQVASDRLDKVQLRGRAAVQYAHAGNTTKAKAIIENQKHEFADETDSKIQHAIMDTIREVAVLEKDNDAVIASMERLCELAPGGSDGRFSLGYQHSQIGNNDMSLVHYIRIPWHERSKMAWNNIGVAYDQFEMPGKSVFSYRKAEEAGETLAMSNLGQKFLKAGFTSEARAIFDKALLQKDCHKNVSLALAQLKDVPDAEGKVKDDLIEKSRPKAEFYQLLGRAIGLPDIAELPKSLRGPECDLDVSVTSGRFRAIGTYTRDVTNALILNQSSGFKATYRIEFEGAIRGHQIVGTVRRSRDGESSSSSILGLDEKIKILIAVHHDRNELRVMENPHGSNPSFYSLNAK